VLEVEITLIVKTKIPDLEAIRRREDLSKAATEMATFVSTNQLQVEPIFYLHYWKVVPALHSWRIFPAVSFVW